MDIVLYVESRPAGTVEQVDTFLRNLDSSISGWSYNEAEKRLRIHYTYENLGDALAKLSSIKTRKLPEFVKVEY